MLHPIGTCESAEAEHVVNPQARKLKERELADLIGVNTDEQIAGTEPIYGERDVACRTTRV